MTGVVRVSKPGFPPHRVSRPPFGFPMLFKKTWFWSLIVLKMCFFSRIPFFFKNEMKHPKMCFWKFDLAAPEPPRPESICLEESSFCQSPLARLQNCRSCWTCPGCHLVLTSLLECFRFCHWNNKHEQHLQNRPNSMLKSTLPGLTRAGSSFSGWFVVITSKRP